MSISSSVIWTDWDRKIMSRCFALARRGGKHVQSNPEVGAVIVHNERIIGEGYHHKYGGPHAERDALANVKQEDKQFLPFSHMYVSLEPCNHHGKTPPCSLAILEAKIPKLTICTQDPTPKLQGKSIQYLSANGVDVRIGLGEIEGRRLIQPFVANNLMNRPYTILKWAQSKDKYIGKKEEQVWLSNKLSKVLVHSWRSEIDAILIGTNTAITDDPQLTTRLVDGSSPHRFVLDKTGRLPRTLKLLSDDNPTTVITTNTAHQQLPEHKSLLCITEEAWNINEILSNIYDLGFNRLMIEGGASLLKSCIKYDLWDEARILKTNNSIDSGIKAPIIKGKLNTCYNLDDNKAMIISRL